MLITTRVLHVALIGVPLFLLTGCGPSKSAGISSSTPNWTIFTEDPIPGIHNGTAHVFTLRFGSPTGVTIVLWSDVSISVSQGATHDDHVLAKGTFFKPDGTRIEYRCKTEDGIVAKVTVDGTTFDSAKGSLFLISTQATKPQVKQVVADVSDFPTKSEAIRDYALGNSEIATFFNDAKKKEPVKQEE